VAIGIEPYLLDELVKAVRVIGSLNDSQTPIEAVNDYGCVLILMAINTNKPVGAYIFHRFYASLKIRGRKEVESLSHPHKKHRGVRWLSPKYKR